MLRLSKLTDYGVVLLAHRVLESAPRNASDEDGDDRGGGEADPNDRVVADSAVHVRAARERRQLSCDFARVNVKERAGKHPEGRYYVVREAHACQTERVVQQAEGEDR